MIMEAVVAWTVVMVMVVVCDCGDDDGKEKAWYLSYWLFHRDNLI